MSATDERPRTTIADQQTIRRPLTPIVLATLFVVAAWPLIFSGVLVGRPAADDRNYHEPTVRLFIEQWPRPDLSDYGSATTPLYHLSLAAVGVIVNDSRLMLQLAASLWTVGLMVLLGSALAKRTATTHAIACGLPVLLSLYVLPPGIWLLPDNAGWLLVLAIMLLALRPRVCTQTIVTAGVMLLVLVLIRQIHIWAAVPLWIAAWLGSASSDTSHSLTRDIPSRIPRSLLMLAATMPAFAAVAYFVYIWNGLVPPTFQDLYAGRSPAAAGFVLALFGFFGPFFVADAWPGLRRLWTRNRMVLLAVAAGAFVVAAAPITTYDVDAGRWTGLWNIVSRSPIIFDRSPVIVLPAVLGAVLLTGMLVGVDFRMRCVMIAALIAFVAAQSASPQLWQRYNEPFVLILLALLSCSTKPRAAGSQPFIATAGPVLLAIMLAIFTTTMLSRWPQIDPNPPAEREPGDTPRENQQ